MTTGLSKHQYDMSEHEKKRRPGLWIVLVVVGFLVIWQFWSSYWENRQLLEQQQINAERERQNSEHINRILTQPH